MLSREYIAGLFDGEGSVTIGCTKKSRTNWAFVPHASLANNYKPILELLQKEFGGYIGPVGGKSRCWALNFTTKAAKDFLLVILPFLVIKKKQAEILVDFIETRQQYQEQPSFRRTTRPGARVYPESYFWFALACRWYIRKLNGTFSEEKYKQEYAGLTQNFSEFDCSEGLLEEFISF